MFMWPFVWFVYFFAVVYAHLSKRYSRLWRAINCAVRFVRVVSWLKRNRGMAGGDEKSSGSGNGSGNGNGNGNVRRLNSGKTPFLIGVAGGTASGKVLHIIWYQTCTNLARHMNISRLLVSVYRLQENYGEIGSGRHGSHRTSSGLHQPRFFLSRAYTGWKTKSWKRSI